MSKSDFRREIIAGHEAHRVEKFKELLDNDPLLRVQAAVDPIETLSAFGLFDYGDNAVEIRVTEGSMTDLLRLKRVVRSIGLAGLRAGGVADAQLDWGIRIRVCVTVCWRNYCVTICIDAAY